MWSHLSLTHHNLVCQTRWFSTQKWLKSLPGREILPLYGTYIQPFPSPSMRLLEILESFGVHCLNRQHKGPSLWHILFCLNPPSTGSVGLCDWFSVYSFSFFSFYALSCSSLLSITLCFPGVHTLMVFHLLGLFCPWVARWLSPSRYQWGLCFPNLPCAPRGFCL